MQKVITIHGISRTTAGNPITGNIKEVVYPELQKFLEDGYKIKETIPMQTGGESRFAFSITFILEKG